MAPLDDRCHLSSFTQIGATDQKVNGRTHGSTRSSELSVAQLQSPWVWLSIALPRNCELDPVHALKTMAEHRAVGLTHQFGGHLDNEIWADPEEIYVVRSMMDFAQRKPVWHDSLTHGLAVGNDVRSVEKFWVVEPTHRERSG